MTLVQFAKSCLLGMTLFIIPCKLIACSCQAYYAEHRRAETPIANDGSQVYTATASVMCTGLRSLDEKKSANEARIELSKTISSEIVATEAVSAFHSGGISSSNFQSNTRLKSNNNLSNAQIFDRWVDPVNCVVFASIFITQGDIDKAKAEQNAKENNKLVNQAICLKVTGNDVRQVENRLETQLIRLGYRVTHKQCSVVMNIESKTEFVNSGYALSHLETELIKSGQFIWKGSYQGKGISYNQNTSRNSLLGKALNDSAEQLSTDMARLKSKSVK